MSGFDITDIGGNAQGQSSNNFSQPVQRPAQQQPQETQGTQPPVPSNRPTVQQAEAEIAKPIVPAKKAQAAEDQGINTNELWNPLSEARPGGQFKAGEVDEKHEAFLKKTEWDTSETKERVFRNRRVR